MYVSLFDCLFICVCKSVEVFLYVTHRGRSGDLDEFVAELEIHTIVPAVLDLCVLRVCACDVYLFVCACTCECM